MILSEIKEAQKSMIYGRRHVSELVKKYDAEWIEWRKGLPEEVPAFISVTCPTCHHQHSEFNPAAEANRKARQEHYKKMPRSPMNNEFSKESARHLNIFYGIVKGRYYTQIEKKADTPYRPSLLKKLCEKYGVDWAAFEVRLNEHAPDTNS